MLKSTEWFIDTFPSIVQLTADPEPVPDELLSFGGGESSSTSKLLEDECSGDNQLRIMCEKFCLVNKCQYTLGLSDYVSPIAGIMAFDSPRLAAHLVAIYQYRDRFSVIAPTGPKTVTAALKSALTGPSKNDQFEILASCVVAALVRFHRPNSAQTLDALFGPNQVPPAVWTWLSSSFIKACDGAATARELIAAIAATGSPATVGLLAVAAIDEVLSSVTASYHSAQRVNEAMNEFEFSPDLLVKLWRVAAAMAPATPATAGEVFALYLTPYGRRELCEKPKDKKKILSSSVPIPMHAKMGLVSVLQVPPSDVISELVSGDRTNTSVHASMEFSISEETPGGSKCLSMDCAAGFAIGSCLRAFSTSSLDVEVVADEKKEWVFIDARTGAEREADDSIISSLVYTPRKNTKSFSSRENTEDWFAESSASSGSATPSPSSAPSFVIHRIKRSLFIDSDMDFSAPQNVDSPLCDMFMRKLEFYRGCKLCLIGEGSTAIALTGRLLQKEFPFVCSVSGGFGALRNVLTTLGERTVREIAIVTAPLGAAAKSSSPWSRSNSSDLKGKLNSLKSSIFGTPPSKQRIAAPPSLILAPIPASSKQPEFEIGEDEADEAPERFSSIDLSPATYREK